MATRILTHSAPPLLTLASLLLCRLPLPLPPGWDPSAPTAEVLLGILSGDVRLAVRALRDYTDALGLPFYMPEPRVPGQTSLAAIQVIVIPAFVTPFVCLFFRRV